MIIYALSGLFFVIILATLILFKLLVKDFKFLHGVLACVLGVATVVPIAFAIYFIQGTDFIQYKDLKHVLFNAILLNGIVEETFKLLVLFFLPSKKMKLPEFFCCSILSGLTVGCFETLVYYVVETNYSDSMSFMIIRLLTAVLIHTSCCALGGLFVYSCKRKSVKLSPYFFAIFLHGTYNYFAGFKTNSPFYYISIAVIIFAVLECRLRYIQINKIENPEPEVKAKKRRKSSSKTSSSKKKTSETEDQTVMKIKGTDDKTLVAVKKGGTRNDKKTK